MYFEAKTILFKTMKYCGLYSVARFINRNKIPVLCYHGVSTNDEHEFMPSNFIRFKTFKQRIDYLLKNQYNIISLEQAYLNLKQGTTKRKSVVLTIDDGFIPIFNELIPYLLERKIPITCYITSYKSFHEIPIFRVVCQYFFWKTSLKSFQIDEYFEKVTIGENSWDFIKYIETNSTREERGKILERLSGILEVEYNQERKDAYSIAGIDLLKKFSQMGLDIQLHTHYHNMDLPIDELREDFKKNIEYLSQCNINPLEHFCYPSGVWREEHFDLMKEFNIKTATTCDEGLMQKDTHPYKIPRIIDSDSMPQIIFEAQLSGFIQMIKKLFLR